MALDMQNMIDSNNSLTETMNNQMMVMKGMLTEMRHILHEQNATVAEIRRDTARTSRKVDVLQRQIHHLRNEI